MCVGTIFFDVGTHYISILARGACVGFIIGYMTFMSIAGFQSYIEEMKVKQLGFGLPKTIIFPILNALSNAGLS